MLKNKINYILFFFILFFTIVCGCSGSDENTEYTSTSIDEAELLSMIKEHPYDLEYNRLWFSINFIQENVDSIKLYGGRLFEKARKINNLKLADLCGVYLTWAYSVSGERDSLEKYLPVAEHVSKTDTLTDVGLIADYVCAVHAVDVHLDYSGALQHLYRGLQIAMKRNDTINISVLLTNIANIYTIREDPCGIPFAEQAYELCKNSDVSYIVVSSSLNLAELLLLDNQFSESMKYVQNALDIAEKSDFKKAYSRCFLIKACALSKMGDDEKALRLFMKARTYLDYADVDIHVQYNIRYGDFLLESGRTREAIRCFRSALNSEGCTSKQRLKVLPMLSQAYAVCGMDKDALECYKHYHLLSDTLSFQQKERDVNKLMMQFERSVYEKDLLRKELVIAEKGKSNITIVLISALVLLAAFAVIVFQVRRQRMYRRLVEQHQQHLLITKKMKEEHQKREELGNQKERDLYDKIECLMNVDKVYRWKDLTVDKMSETLNSNRTYVSKIVNNYSGMTFVNYVNYKRIEEATEILSNPDEDIPLKMLSDQIGYNSMSTFYRAFQKETGCSPSRYREEIQKKARKDSSKQTD